MAVSALRQSAFASSSAPDSSVPVAEGAQRAAEPFDGYGIEAFHDEMFFADGRPRPCCQPLFERVQGLPTDELRRRQRSAERSMLRLGITFNVYGDQQGTERIIPFDILPRIIEEREWRWIERGLKQRITALNLFI